ncbi:hypothetical protein ACWGNE_24355 [Streptomyces xiamenensis]
MAGTITVPALRRHFRRALGVPPDSYRRTFRGGRVPPPRDEKVRPGEQ